MTGGQRMDNSVHNRPQDDEIEISLYDIAVAVFRKKIMICIFIIVSLAAAILYLSVADPVYEAKATVMVSSLSGEGSDISSLLSGFAGGGSADIATEVALLTSRTTMENALSSLDLSRYTDPEGVKYSELEFPIKAENLIRGNKVSVSSVSDTNIVSITVQDTNPRFAADLANAVALAFNKVLTGFAKGGSEASIDFVESQIPVVQEQLVQASRQLADFQKDNDVLLTTQESQISLLRYNYLSSRKAPLELECGEADAILSAATSAPTYDDVVSMEPVKSLADEISAIQRELLSYDLLAVSTAAGNTGGITSVLTASQQNRYFTLSNRLVSIQTQIEQIAASVPQSGFSAQDAAMYSGAVTQKLFAEKEIALISEMMVVENASLESIPELEMQLAALTSNVEVYQTMVVSLMQMQQEAQLRDAAISDNVTLIDNALVPELPVSPNKLVVLAVAFFLGAFAGVALALVMELSDKSIFSSDDLRKALPDDVPFLGWIPMLKVQKKSRYVKNVVYSNPNSYESEKYKLIASNIVFGRNSRNRVMTVCSTEKNEGKTSVMANIAIALTQNGYKVILVDGDLRMPSCEQFFNLEHQERGLVDILMNEEPLDNCIVLPIPEVDMLNLLPCGTKPAIPSMVYASDKFPRVIEELKHRYDIIIFDAPPLAYASELLALTKLAPEVIIVTRAGVTNKYVLGDMIDNFKAAGATVIGACLNAVIASHGKSKGYGSYSYSYADKNPEAMASVMKRVPLFSSRKMYYRKRYRRDEKFRGKKENMKKNRPMHPYNPELDLDM